MQSDQSDDHSEACEWLAKIVCAEDVFKVLPDLSVWLRTPAHRTAFTRVEIVWRLIGPALRAQQPSAGYAEYQAYDAAWNAEWRRYPYHCSTFDLERLVLLIANALTREVQVLARRKRAVALAPFGVKLLVGALMAWLACSH